MKAMFHGVNKGGRRRHVKNRQHVHKLALSVVVLDRICHRLLTAPTVVERLVNSPLGPKGCFWVVLGGGYNAKVSQECRGR